LKWDGDGEGSVSRKEFRMWWPNIGYDVPPYDLNDLFDEFDVDGSGEIDVDEFKNAFEQKGRMWQEMRDLLKQNDESAAIHRAIVELEAKIGRKQKSRIIEGHVSRRIEDKLAARLPNVTALHKEIKLLQQEMKQHQTRLDMLKGGIKTQMKALSVLRAFGGDPDSAAAAIQARVRGRAAQRLVMQKRTGQRPPTPRSQMLLSASRHQKALATGEHVPRVYSSSPKLGQNPMVQSLNMRLMKLQSDLGKPI